MAGQADGSIIIDTEMDTKGFKAGSAELHAAMKSFSNTANKLQKQMRDIGAQKFATDEYKQVQQDIVQAEKHLDRYNQKRAQLSGKGKVDTPEWEALIDDIKAANAELTRLRALKAEMEQTGTAYVAGTQTQQYQRLSAELLAVQQSIAVTREQLSRLGRNEAFAALVQKARQFAWTLARSGIQKLVSGIRSAASHMTRLVTQSRLMKRPLQNMSFLLRRIAPSLLMTEGLFGLLRKAVNAFLQENEHLAAKLNACWSGIGNILGPIITRLIDLVSTAVAYVTSFLNLLGYVGKSTANAINKAGSSAEKETDKLKGQLTSIDELNVLQNNDSDSGGEGNSNPGLPDVTLPDWIRLVTEKLKAGNWTEAATILTAELNAMVDSADWSGLGDRLAYGLDGALTFLATAITTFDWYALGAGIGKFFNSVVRGVDWANLGIVLGWKLIALVEGLGGLFATLDWHGLGQALSDCFMGLWSAIDWKQAAKTLSDGLIGALNALTSAIANVNWQQVGDSIATFLGSIDYSGIVTALFEGIGAVLVGLGRFLYGLFEDAFDSLARTGQDIAEKYGVSVAEGVLLGILQGLVRLGAWVVKNIFNPFIKAFKSAFGIHSPSKVMREQGEYIIEGLLSGLKGKWGGLFSWVDEVFDGLTDTITSWADSTKNSIKGWASNTYTTISNKVSSVKSTISSGFNAAKTSIVTSLQSAMNTVKGQNWYGVGSNICTGIGNGIDAGWSWLKTKVSNLAKNLLSAAKAALGIRSPSRLFRNQVGLNIGYGIGEGIEGSERSVLDSVVGVADAIAREFNANEYSIGSLVSGTGIDSALTAFSDKIANSFSALMDRMQAIAGSASFGVPAVARGFAVPYTAQAKHAFRPTGETAVSSTGQIIDGISDAVYSAMLTAMRQTEFGGNPNVNVYLDGRQITAVVEKRQHERGATLMGKEVFAY